MSPSRLGAGCLIAFALPFAATGIGVFVGIARLISAGSTPPKQLFLMTAFALAFSIAGFSLIFGAIWGVTQGGKKHDQPANRIVDDSKAGTVMLWVFALLWNSIASPVLVLVPDEVRKGNYVALVGLLFPLLGLGIISIAVQATMRAIRFHRSTLVLSHVPVPVGGALRGHVEVPYAPLADATSIVVRLTAVDRRSSGKSSTETVLWQEEQEIARGSVGRSPDGVLIPIQIPIPDDAPASSSDRHARTIWRLTVDGEVPGIDYSATFEVPVAHTDVPPELRALLPQGPPPEPREPADFRSKQTAYGRELYFPPFRARGFAMGTLFITLCWSTVTAVLFVADVPLFFALVFAAFAVLLLIATLDLFFSSTRIVLGPDRVTIHRQFFHHRETILPRREIASARAAIGSSSGSRPYYDVEVQTTAGKKLKAAKYIRGKREAEWVASQIRGALDSPP